MTIVGIGNRFRGDDGAGPLCASMLAKILGTSATVLEQSGEASLLLETLQDASDVILIDAVRSGAAPGSIFRLDPRGNPLPRAMFAASTHAFGVPEAIELARTFGKLPLRLIVYGVEGSSFAPGEVLSPPVERAIDALIDRIAEECTQTASNTIGQ